MKALGTGTSYGKHIRLFDEVVPKIPLDSR
jgi:hypothetical protein